MSWRSPSAAPPRSWTRPVPGWPGRCQTARLGWSACTIRMSGRSARAASTGPSSSGRRPRSPATTTASSSTTASRPATPRTLPSSRPRSAGLGAAPAARRARSPPTAVTTSPRPARTWRRSGPHGCHPAQSVDLTRPPGRRTCPRVPPARQGRTGSEGRISHLKHRYGWDRTRLDGREGASIWCRHAVFAHNLTKISALSS